MNKRINNLFFLYVVACIFYGIGLVYWDKNQTALIFFPVALVLGIMIIFSKDFYEEDTYQFFRKNAIVIFAIYLFTFFTNQEYPPIKAMCFAFDRATFGVFFFFIILFFRHFRKLHH